MHQSSALSPLLFVIVMETISREFRVALPWELLYADDLVVIAETEEHLIKRVNDWKNYKCGPTPNVMAAQPNIGGALCSTPQSLADAHY